ncbi:unnamed protein product [Lymnaea stagnalis]|uniref:Uncharacterized protein n=1 Tax=Lymnaea stagnalis TaxID=6523 RepID=A0AAV2IL67_LYMST
MPGTINDSTPLLGQNGSSDIHTYKRRWYILTAFSLFAFTQGAVWNTWGPISTTSEEVYDWQDSTIAWMSNWGPIAYILSGFFFFWLLQVKGLRWSVLSSSFLLAVGTVLRILTSEPQTATVLIHMGQFLCGMAGPIAMGSPALLSSVWFPPQERVTATSIGSSSGILGVAVSFIIGPAIIDWYMDAFNRTHATNDVKTEVDQLAVAKALRINLEQQGISQYMYYECAWSCSLFLLVLCYFPSKPDRPPSASASMERSSYWSGLWSLRNKTYFLIVAFTYGVAGGVLNAWYSVLSVNLRPLGVSENKAGWIGFYSTVCSCLCALAVGRFADQFVRRMKELILLILVCSGLCFLVFSFMVSGTIHYSEAILYFTLIVGGSLIYAAVPLMFELACELAYPTSEGAANGMLTYLNNMGSMLFLLVLSFPDVGTTWMNWALTCSIFVCVPLIALLKAKFHRLEIDEGLQSSVNAELKIHIA